MPRYTIEDTNSGIREDFWGSYDEMKEHVSKNPNLRTVIGAPRIVSGSSVTDSTSKIPDGFKDKLREIKKKHPESTGVDHLL